MKKGLFLVLPFLIGIFFLSFGRNPLLTCSRSLEHLDQDWASFLTLSRDETALLDFPPHVFSSMDLYLPEDPAIESFFDTMHKEILLEQEKNPIAGLDYDGLLLRMAHLLGEGNTRLEGPDSLCRPLFVTLQGCIEEGIAAFLSQGVFLQAKVLFLTNTPCTPLMKRGLTPGLTAFPFDPARQYTLDKREKTLRQLIYAGGKVLTAYSAQKYDEIEQDPALSEQLLIFQEGLEENLFSALPLASVSAIAPEMIGAIYEITTSTGNRYWIALRGIQAREARPGLWEIWMASSENPLTTVNLRRVQTISYILRGI